MVEHVCQGANPLRNVMAVLWIVVKDVGKISLKYSIVGLSKFGCIFWQ